MTKAVDQAQAGALAPVDLLDPPGGEALRMRFGGMFEGRKVTWDATLLALGAEPATHNYIEVGATTDAGIALIVGLAVARIDLPTVHKTVIMVRGYRRLRRGRHEWESV